MHIVGTAGHVDHGKSALIQALTGTNPDRWVEEQVRGMTLDLGFAPLRFDDGIEAGIVDVPGHERFIHNMLAGASGMELLLLVVSAAEGVMPQTIEHLQILRMLNVRRTIVVVTKSDLFDSAQIAARVDAIASALRGTIAADASYVAVSNTTRAGLDDLLARIHDELAALPSRDPDAPAYVPIDRVFALPGRGTIVTGTLMQGRIAVGDTLALEPSGARVRVRSLHVFGEARDIAFGGTRVALNLPGVDRAAISRGEVIADPQFEARAQFTVRFTPLAEAVELLRARTPVRAHIGSAEVLGTLRLDAAPISTETLVGELHLRRPIVAFPGVRFVLRRVSPKVLLGGGEVAATLSAAPSEIAGSASQDTIASVLLEAKSEPLEITAIAFRANLREEVAQEEIDALLDRGAAIKLLRPTAYLDGAVAQEILARVTSELQALHDAEPWAMGATSIQLSRKTGIVESLLVRLLSAFAEDGRIAARFGYFALLEHQPHLSIEQRAFFDELVPLDPAQPHVPAVFDEAAAKVKGSAIPGAPKAFDMLLARGSLVKVGDALYRGSQIGTIHAKVEDFINRNSRMTMAQFRDLIGTSRKYAVPLLEYFDAAGVTLRRDDVRVLRRATSFQPIGKPT